MKIAVKDLEPNPYRKEKNYPYDRAKVEALKTSIKEKTFWDNILVRKRGNKYQLAYGHHRWVALKELGIKEIDIPVRDIDDATMVKIMAEENLNWNTSPAVMTQTILAAKEFLEKVIADYPYRNKAPDFVSLLWADDIAYKKSRTEKCIGEPILTKFLGGNWTGYKIGVALNILRDKDLDRSAVCSIPTIGQARVFQNVVKKHKIPKSTQKKLAKTIVKEGVGKRDIPDLVAEAAPMPLGEKTEPKELPMLDDIVRQTSNKVAQLCTDLTLLKKGLPNIQSQHVKNLFQTKLKGLKRITDELLLALEAKNETQKKKVLARTDS